MATDKLKILQQTALAIIYLTEFQIQATQTNYNKIPLRTKTKSLKCININRKYRKYKDSY